MVILMGPLDGPHFLSPHPGPLPWGEGESSAVFRPCPRRSLPIQCAQNARQESLSSGRSGETTVRPPPTVAYPRDASILFRASSFFPCSASGFRTCRGFLAPAPAQDLKIVSSLFRPWLNPYLMHNPIIVALDVSKPEAALELVERLAPVVGAFKVGKELFVSAGPEVVRKIRATGASVFLDLKFHDIPNTVAKAVAAAAQLDVQMLSVHASGGAGMLRAAERSARESARPPGRPPPLVLGVT